MASIIPFFIQHLGCPHRCLFCNQSSIAGVSEKQEYPQREVLDTVINEWLARFRSPDDVQLAFYGGSFTCLPAEVQVDLLESITPYLERGQIRGVRLSTRPD